MLKKSITYSDLDGNSVTDDFYFNLSKSELVEMELSEKDGLSAQFQQADQVGGWRTDHRRSQEGPLHVCWTEVRRRKDLQEVGRHHHSFMQSDAYSELFMSLVSQPDGAVEFITGIMPASLAGLPNPKPTVLVKDYSAEELLEMSDTEFALIAGTDPKEMTKTQLIVAMQRKNKAA